MNAQEFILIFLLQFEVASFQTMEVFARAGDVATLPCKRSSCSSLTWLYSRDQNGVVAEVRDGRVVSSSPRSHRLSLKDDCSLLIRRVGAEDAGYFVCETYRQQELNVILMVMTLTPLPPQDSDPVGERHVLLECSLTCWPADNCRCLQGGLRWADEQGEALRPARTEPSNCVSSLKVVRVSSESTYTCQYVARAQVKVQAQYTAALTKGNAGGPGGPAAPPPERNLIFIIIGAGVGVLMLIIIIVAIILVKIKAKRNAGQEFSKHEDDKAAYASVTYDHRNTESDKQQDGLPEETESGVTYATVNLNKKKKKEDDNAKKQVAEAGEEQVTYAAVRTPARIPPQQDGSQ